ncbi:hypothetical protein FACS1894137_08430 [Spirochaetia bacterium]|nr:hypothetical protein FACS1894137_08430 [Spirochaetia bacterium]
MIIQFPDPVEAAEQGSEDECPLCAIYTEPNEETLAAIEESRAMRRREIPTTWYNSLDEMWEDLHK